MNLTLSQRLSVVFSILLLACCGASVWLQVRANDMHEKEVVQGLSRDLARSIALENRLVGTEGLTMEGVRTLFGQLMNVNPSVEVYLLDPSGRSYWRRRTPRAISSASGSILDRFIACSTTSRCRFSATIHAVPMGARSSAPPRCRAAAKR